MTRIALIAGLALMASGCVVSKARHERELKLFAISEARLKAVEDYISDHEERLVNVESRMQVDSRERDERSNPYIYEDIPPIPKP
jgi:hypothetical protein